MKTESANTIFDLYSPFFASVTTIYQSEELRAVAQYLKGHVLDLGCGSAKLAAYLLDENEVLSYFGVDASKAMCEEARRLLAILDDKRFTIMHSTIEQCSVKNYDWAVCLNALYAVKDPLQTLINCHNLLNANGKIILSVPNENLNMKRLLTESRKDLVLHPLFYAFTQINYSLASSYASKFLSMAQLRHLLEMAGFCVEEAHVKFFDGGINFVVARKIN